MHRTYILIKKQNMHALKLIFPDWGFTAGQKKEAVVYRGSSAPSLQLLENLSPFIVLCIQRFYILFLTLNISIIICSLNLISCNIYLIKY